jgi:hypothetical protein
MGKIRKHFLGKSVAKTHFLEKSVAKKDTKDLGKNTL